MSDTQKWDVRFLQLASLVSNWSKDPSTKVGAVIVDKKNRIISIGFNGFPRGAKDDHRLNIREAKYKLVIHAEENAVLNATSPLENCTIFLTHPPCNHCAGVLKQVGISRVVFEEPSSEFKSRWNFKEIIDYLNELGIEISTYRRVSDG